MTLAQAIELHVMAALHEAGGNVSEAARRLKVHRTTIHRMLKQWDAAREQRDVDQQPTSTHRSSPES